MYIPETSHEVIPAQEAPRSFSINAPLLLRMRREMGIRHNVSQLVTDLFSAKAGAYYGSWRSQDIYEKKQQELQEINKRNVSKFIERLKDKMVVGERKGMSENDRVRWVRWVAATAVYSLAQHLNERPEIKSTLAEGAMLDALEAGFGWSREAAGQLQGFSLSPLERTAATALVSEAMSIGRNGMTLQRFYTKLSDYIVAPISDSPTGTEPRRIA